MASIVFNLELRSVKNGMAPIRLRISHRGTNAWYPTKVAVEPSCFVKGALYEPISRKARLYEVKREQLAAIVRRYEEGVYELLRAEGGREQLDGMTAKELRDFIFGVKVKKTAAQVVKARKRPNDVSFMDFFDKYGQTRRSARSVENYAYVWKLLYQYMNERSIRYMTFSDITYKRLVDIREWLRNTGRGDATRFKVESYVRAVYREALRMGLCSRDADPFINYKIEQVPERDIVVISREQLRKLMNFDCGQRPGVQRAKDILLASFYLCGINFQDLFELPSGEEACYVRHKIAHRTQRSVHIRIEPELAEIVAKYEGDGKMFNFNGYMTNIQHRIERCCVKLSRLIGFKVNFAIIRRTWATLAAEIECPDSVINKSMGHIVRSVNARYYEQYDWSRTAKWNRRVIDYVLAL